MILEAGIGLQAVRLADVADAARQLARPPAGCCQIALQAMDSSDSGCCRQGRNEKDKLVMAAQHRLCHIRRKPVRGHCRCKRSTCTAGGSSAGAALLMRLPRDESAGGAISS